MPISKFILAYLLTSLVFFAIDMVWLGLLAKGLYQRMLGPLLAEQVNWAAALVFYFLFIGGIFIFAILPALEKESWRYALLYGCLFGFFTYATYDLTNLATLRDWPVKVVVVDVAWGTLLCTTVASTSYWMGRWLS